METTSDWREHFSANAGDLVQLVRWTEGDTAAQELMLACFKRTRCRTRVNETTVLDELQRRLDADREDAR